MAVDIHQLLPQPFVWCDIPAGDVTLTDLGGYLKAITTFTIPTFSVSHDLITPAQYAVFMTHPIGYANLEWWQFSDEAMLWRTQNTEPIIDPKQPYMKDVTWYDAIAFCRWISSLTGEIITLPTDQQWEHLSKYDDLGCYVWGVYDDSLMMYEDVISEWCLNTYETGSTDLQGNIDRLIRLGYWHDSDQARFRVRMRVKCSPALRGLSRGFRLVCNGLR